MVYGGVGLAWRKLERHSYRDLRDTSQMIHGRVDLMLRKLVEGVGEAPMGRLQGHPTRIVNGKENGVVVVAGCLITRLAPV